MTTSEKGTPPSDHAIEQVVGRLLQLGVLIAAVVVLIGGILLLTRHGAATVDYSKFRGEPEYLRSVSGVVRAVFAMDAAAIVQFGLLLLIATPIARVTLTLVAFVLQRDHVYIGITTVVLALLLYGLVFGTA